MENTTRDHEFGRSVDLVKIESTQLPESLLQITESFLDWLSRQLKAVVEIQIQLPRLFPIGSQ